MMLTSLLITLMMSTSIETSNILAVLPIPSKSHHHMFRPIIKELGRKGHNVTVISPYEIDTNLTNIKQMIVHTSEENYINEITFEDILKLGELPLFIPPQMSFWTYGLRACEDYFKSEEVQKLIHSDDKFDLILLETSFGQESMIGFSHKFNAPVVTLNSNINHLLVDEFIGNPLSLAFVPHQESDLVAQMSFYGRLWNVVRSLVVLTNCYYFYLPQQEMLMKTYFNYTSPENIPPIVEMLKYNISLAISNAHISFEAPRPMVPNVINAAGMHIKKKPERLPMDLQEYLDKSVNGFIYFSFGTIIPAHLMPTELKNNFVNAFRRLKQNVLWKISDDKIENLPNNVKVAKWFPQQSILAHPNCIGFITHGGLLSFQESIYFGVPIIGIAYFSDQNMNIRRGEKLGHALKLSNQNLTEDSIFWAVNEVVGKNRYREAAIKYSKVFHDNPIETFDNVIYWIEYVIRHKGAPHLRTAKLDLPKFQYLLIDVALFLLFIFIISSIFVYLSVRLFIKQFLKLKTVTPISNKKFN